MGKKKTSGRFLLSSFAASSADGFRKKKKEKENDRRIIISLGTYDGGLLGYFLSSSSLLTLCPSPSSSPPWEDAGSEKKAMKTREAELKNDSRSDKHALDGIKEEREDEQDDDSDRVFSSSPPPIQLKILFALNPHVGCVKAIASSESLLVTGSTDECIRIYSLQRLREVGVLNTPSSGTITAVALIEESFLLSGDSRGFLKLWRCSDWSLLRCMDTRKAQEESRLKKSGEGRGGRGLKRKKEKKSADDEDQDDGALVEGKFGIRSLAVHASSRLCFVLNEKNFLQLWNLMDGTCSAVTQLFGGEVRGQIDCVRWQPGIDSSLYALLSPREVSVISAADGGEDAEGNSGAVVLRIPSNSAPRPSLGGGEDEGEEEEEVALSPPASWTCMCFASKSILLLGDSLGGVWAVSLRQRRQAEEEEEEERKKVISPSQYLYFFKGSHRMRIKSIEVLFKEPEADQMLKKRQRENGNNEEEEKKTLPSSSCSPSPASSRQSDEGLFFVTGDASGSLHLWALPTVSAQGGGEEDLEKTGTRKRKGKKTSAKTDAAQANSKETAIAVLLPLATAESRCRLTCLAASSFVAPPRDFPGRALVERSPSSSSSPPTFRNGSLTRHVSLDRGVSGCVDNDKKNQSEEDLSLSACVAKKEKNAGKKGRSAAEASVNVSSQGLASSSSKQERNQKAEGGDKGSLLPRKEHGRARDPQTKDRREQGEGSLIAKEMSGAPGVHTLHQKGMKRKKGESGVSFQKKQKRKLFMQNGGNSSL